MVTASSEMRSIYSESFGTDITADIVEFHLYPDGYHNFNNEFLGDALTETIQELRVYGENSGVYLSLGNVVRYATSLTALDVSKHRRNS